MEACGGAHHLDRVFIDQGHAVRLMSPEWCQVRRLIQLGREILGEVRFDAGDPSPWDRVSEGTQKYWNEEVEVDILPFFSSGLNASFPVL